MWDPIHHGREVFLGCMRAISTPGTAIELPPTPEVCGHPELDGAAGVLFGLLDGGLSLAVAGDGVAQQVGALAIAETGAARADIAAADWVLVHGSAADAITRAPRGTRMAPESGATLLIAATGKSTTLSITGPGIAAPTTVSIPLDAVAARAFSTANAAPPCGVDLLIVTAGYVVGLPRSSSVRFGAA